MGIEYARDNMSQLVQSLAADIRPLPERLAAVFGSLNSAIDDAQQDGYLSDDLLARMQEVRYRLTHVNVKGNVALLLAALGAMDPNEARQIAIELVQLNNEVTAHREGTSH